MAGKFELKKSKSGKFMFNLKAGNGQVILTSELYSGKSSAENGISSVQTNGSSRDNFEEREAKDGSPYFVLKAKNGQIIGKSEMYKSKAACNNGIESVMKNAPDARVVDDTE